MEVISRLMPYLIKYKKWIFLSIISNILLSIFTVISIPLIIPFFRLLFNPSATSPAISNLSGFEHTLDNLFVQMLNQYGKEGSLLLVCGALLVLFFFKNAFRYAALAFMAPMRNGIVKDLRKALHDKFLHLPISYYAFQRKGDLIARATSDVGEVEWSVLNVIESIFKAPIIMVGSLLFMLYINIKLTLFVIILLLFTGVIIGGIVRQLRKNSPALQYAIGDISSTIEESINGVRVVKAFVAEDYQKSKFDHINTSLERLINKFMFRRELAVPTSEFLGVGIVIILLWYGAQMVFKGDILPETFFAYIFAFYQVIEPSKTFTNAYSNIQKGNAALDRIYEVIDTPNPIEDGVGGKSITTFSDKIQYDNVYFTYKGSDIEVLEGINLDIKKGEVVALVGPSGGGKSTLMDLLLRLQDCTSGAVYIDGQNTKELTLASLRSLFGVVTQDAILFNDTVMANICLGRESSEVDVWDALEKANAAAFVKELGGLNYNIGDKGMKMSGGQRQRLTIARAILSNPPILLLDEATSALDSESEAIVQQSLDNALLDRTAIIIAHRLSTIKNADKIVVIDQGKIVQIGNHNSLQVQEGLYNKLLQGQKFN